MKNPRAALVAAVLLPFLAGCVRVHAQSASDAAGRDAGAYRGVVLRDAAGGGRVEFSRVDAVEWTDTTLTLTGEALPRPGGAPAGVTTRRFALADVEGVLVRGVDANRTSVLIAAIGVGAAIVGAFVITGENNEGRARPAGP